MTPTLKPCPFCGGEADLDTNQAYRALLSGTVGKAIAAHCTKCDASIQVCFRDVPDITPEAVAEMWNTQPVLDNVTMLVRRLAYQLRRYNPASPLAAEAVAYLSRVPYSITRVTQTGTQEIQDFPKAGSLKPDTPPIVDPQLIAALAQRDYPLSSYGTFAQQWPYTPEQIEEQHRWQHSNGWISGRDE